MGVWETIAGSLAYGAGTGLAGGYVWAFFTAKSRDDAAAADAPTHRFWREAPPRPKFGTDNFELTTQCPRCGIVGVQGFAKWQPQAGVYRECRNCKNVWWQG